MDFTALYVDVDDFWQTFRESYQQQQKRSASRFNSMRGIVLTYSPPEKGGVSD